MYKTELSEARILQKDLLETSAARFFYLHQVLEKLEHQERYKPGEILKYWNDNVQRTKDNWNKPLYRFHAQARTLFTPTLADMLVVSEEDEVVIDDKVLDKLDEATYESTKPRSLHGAFVDAHATVNHLLKNITVRLRIE